MQTFLPFADFELSAQVLDMRRLGKQRVECLQLLKGQWPNHPASKMWRGYEAALTVYGYKICREWISRGYEDTCLEQIRKYRQDTYELPPWFGDEDFHLSHQSNLIRKDPVYYSSIFVGVSNNLPYVWPGVK